MKKYIYFIINLLFFLKCQELTIFTLPDNKSMIIRKDGIHFLNENMREEINKEIIFENQLSDDVLYNKIKFNKFSKDDKEYIILGIGTTIYIFEKDGTLKNSISLSEIKFESNFTIIPFKSENNHLHYIILNEKVENFSFVHFKTDINSKNSNEIIYAKNLEKSNKETYISKLNCIFLSSSKNRKKILICLYLTTSPLHIIARTFDPENNFIELKKFSTNYNISFVPIESLYYFSIINGENKEKDLIYIILDFPYILTFDLENGFSNMTKLKNLFTAKNDYTQNKVLYLEDINEYLVLSSIKDESSKIYAININEDFNKINERVIEQDFQCTNLNTYSSFSNGTLYRIIYKDKKYYSIILSKRGRKLANFLNDEKCLESTESSSSYNLCTICNNAKNYFQVKRPISATYSSSFVECYSESTKPSNFFLDSSDHIYKPCYETCSECTSAGNEYDHKCTKCAEHYITSPKVSTDCITSCTYFYYFTEFDQYKCTTDNNCPEDSSIYIYELKKCTDDCKKESVYKFQYGGRCYKACPEGTIDNNFVCQDKDPNACTQSKFEADLQDSSIYDTVDINAKTYIKEFGYSNKHVSYYKNNLYSIIYYKDYQCLSNIQDVSKFDLDSCLEKVKSGLYLNDNIIIALLERNNGNGIQSSTKFFFYHPTTGEKIEINDYCKDDEVIVKENVLSQLNNSGIDIEEFQFMAAQGINIMDLNDPFYTDICFHFESPNGKDIPLKDRVGTFFKNVTLCDEGCTNEGINLTSMECICKCKMEEILDSNLIGKNALMDNTIGEVTDFIENSNLDVLQCFHDVFRMKYFKHNTGGIILLVIIFIEIGIAVLFFILEMNKIVKYLYNLSEFFANLITINKKYEKFDKFVKVEKKEIKQDDHRKKVKNKSLISNFEKITQKNDKILQPPKKDVKSNKL